MRDKEANRQAFLVETALEVLQTAVEEYEEAVSKGRIKNVVEYQDARGFVLESERLLESVAPGLEAKNSAALTSMRAAITDLKAVFPSPMPPARAVKELGQFLADVSRVELQMSQFQ